MLQCFLHTSSSSTYFFGFPSFTVDSSGLLEYFGTCIVTDGSLTFSLFLPQVTPSPPGHDGKPVFGPHVDPGEPKKNEHCLL